MPVRSLAPEAARAVRFAQKPTVTEKVLTVQRVAGSLNMTHLRSSHHDAILSSPSLNRHSLCALQLVENDPGLIEPNPKLGPLSPIGSLDIYSVMGAGLLMMERGISPEDVEAFTSGVLAALTKFEGIRAKGLLSANTDRFLSGVYRNDVAFASPAMTSLSIMAKNAREHGYAVPAINVNNMEMVEAALAAAAVMRAPVILEWSPGANKYHGGAVASSILTRILANAPMAAGLPVPVCCHLDHGTTDAVLESIAAGFTSVMYDATEAGQIENVSYDDNITRTAELAKRAHDKGISIEGELGGPAGSFHDVSTLPFAERRKFLTDPAMAVDFVARTRVDLLAVSVGTSHGAQKFAGTPFIDTELLINIRRELDKAGFSDIGLVFHGGSDNSPFMEDIARLTGKPYKKPPSGTPVALQQEAIAKGSVIKINLDTIFRNAMAYAVLLMREKMGTYLAEKAKDDFRDHVGIPWRTAVMLEAMRKLVELGTAGQAMNYPGFSATGTGTESRAGKAIE